MIINAEVSRSAPELGRRGKPEAYDLAMELGCIARFLVAALACVGLVACESAAIHHPTGTPPTAAGNLGRTRLSGLVEVCGDPTMHTRLNPGTNRCTLQAGHVSVLRTGRLVATSRLAGGRFSFTVTPGAYTVIAWNGGNGPWKYDVSTKILHGKPLYIIIRAI
jgi:hypothetical protein